MPRKSPCCANCDFYDPDEVVEVTTHMTNPYSGHVFSSSLKMNEKRQGACKLHPHVVIHKSPDDWCGQHPEIQASIRK